MLRWNRRQLPLVLITRRNWTKHWDNTKIIKIRNNWRHTYWLCWYSGSSCLFCKFWGEGNSCFGNSRRSHHSTLREKHLASAAEVRSPAALQARDVTTHQYTERRACTAEGSWPSHVSDQCSFPQSWPLGSSKSANIHGPSYHLWRTPAVWRILGRYN